MNVIDTFLATFIRYIDSGFGLLAGDVAYLSTSLIIIDVTLAGLFWALGQNVDVIAGLIKKVLYVGFFAFVIGNFSALSNIIFDSFARLGIVATGGALTPADLMRPGFIASIGFNAAQPLLAEIADMLGPISFFHHFIMIIVMFIAWAIIMAAFFVLAVQLFITILEFKLTSLAGFILVPFALWNKTTFLAERVLGNVITSGVKLMVLAVIIGIGSTLFSSVTGAFQTGSDVTLSQVMGTVLAAIVFFWMGLFAPGIASGLISGGPQLGAGSAAAAGASAAAATYFSGMGGAKAVSAAARGSGGALKAGASIAGAARTSYALGSSTVNSGGVKAAAAGTMGVARAGVSAAGERAARPARAVANAYHRGSRAAWSSTGGAGPRPQTNHSGQSAGNRAAPRLSQLGQATVHGLRDGDRGVSGPVPKLNNEEA